MKAEKPVWKPALNFCVLCYWISWPFHVNLKSKSTSGTYKVCNVTHNFNLPENLSKIIFRIAASTSNPVDEDTMNNISIHLIPQYIFISSVQSLSHVRLFATPWMSTRQASLSITNSWSLPRFMSIESVVTSNHLILCRPLLLLPSIFPSFRVFSNESALCIRWPKSWSFSFNISPSSEHLGLISLQSKGLWRVFSNTAVQKRQLFCTQLSL